MFFDRVEKTLKAYLESDSSANGRNENSDHGFIGANFEIWRPETLIIFSIIWRLSIQDFAEFVGANIPEYFVPFFGEYSNFRNKQTCEISVNLCKK